jgi:hypothetical protein
MPLVAAHRQTVRLALMAAGVQALLAFGMTYDRMFKKSGGNSGVFTDVQIYFDWSSRVVSGDVPYRDFFIEYPPLSLPFTIVPRLFTTTFVGYKIAFALEMLVLAAILLQMVAAWVEDHEGPNRVASRLLWAVAILTLLGRLVPTRLDLAPTLMAFTGACWWFGCREVRGGVLIGLGFLTKVFPGVVAFPGLVWDLAHRHQWRFQGTLAVGLTVALGMSGWFLLSPVNVAGLFRYHSQRGLEVGSLCSGVVLLAERALGQSESVSFNFGSMNLDSPISLRIARLSTLGMLAGLAAVLGRFAQTVQDQGVSAAGLAILTFVLTSKVLSPQYLLWCVPFVLVLEGNSGGRVRVIYAAACLLTLALYLRFDSLIRLSLPSILILNLRNSLLAAAWVVWYLALRPAPGETALPVTPGTNGGRRPAHPD